MSHYALVYQDSGDLYGTGSIIADPVPDGLYVVELSRPPDYRMFRWDSEMRMFVLRSAPDLGPYQQEGQVDGLDGQIRTLVTGER